MNIDLGKKKRCRKHAWLEGKARSFKCFIMPQDTPILPGALLHVESVVSSDIKICMACGRVKNKEA